MKKIFFIRALLSAFIIFIGSIATAETTEEVKQKIIDTANESGVEAAVVLSIAKTESGFNQKTKGPGGHIGVFQLSPATAKTLGVNPYKLDENIKGGVVYYKKMYDMFGSHELAIAAYNSGPFAVKRCNNKIPDNSKKFVTKIMRDYNAYRDAGL